MYRQKKWRINHTLFALLSSGYAQRDAADFFNVTRKTIARRWVLLGEQSRGLNRQLIELYQQRHGPINAL